MTVAFHTRASKRTFSVMVLIFMTFCVFAKKPDSAFPDSVWTEERILLALVCGEDNEADAAAYMKLAELFRDSERELAYLDSAGRCAEAAGDKQLVRTVSLVRLEHYAKYESSPVFDEYARRTRELMVDAHDIRAVNVDHIIIKRYIDEGRVQTALSMVDKMLKGSVAANDFSISVLGGRQSSLPLQGKPDEARRYMEAYANFSLGLIYTATNRSYEAAGALEKSIDLMTGLGDKFPEIDKIKAYLELLSFQNSLGRYQESIKSCNTADMLLAKFIEDNNGEEVNRRSMRLYIRSYLSRNYMAMGDMLKAKRFLDLASDCIYPEIGEDVETYNETFALYCMHEGRYDEALEYIGKSVQAFSRKDLFPYYMEALELQTEILAAKGDWRRAYENLQNIRYAQDSTDSFLFASQLGELHTLYEVDKFEAMRKRQQTLLSFSLILCFLLAIIVVIYNVYSVRLRRKNQSLFEQINSNLRNETKSAIALQMASEDSLSKEMLLFRKISSKMREDHPFTEPSFGRLSLSKLMGTNDKYVADAVKAGAGVTIAAYISDLRLAYSLDLLTDEDSSSLEDVALSSGFGSYSSFFRAFMRKYSISPSEYRSFYLKNR